MMLHTDSQAVDDQVAAMLHAGATREQIAQQLRVSGWRIHRVRTERQIPVPPGRGKRSRAELDALADTVVAMLRAGATVREIRARTRYSLNDIAALRRAHNLPVPAHDRQAAQRRTIEQALAMHTRPAGDGHVIWTGPRSGRGVDLIASGRRYNARAVAFARHHGREPEGRIRRTCDEPDCIAGAHHTDHTIRTAQEATAVTAVRADVAAMLRAGATYTQIRHELHVSTNLIARTRRALNIPLPDRHARPAADAREQRAAAMLAAGATYAQIHSELRLSSNDIARIRRTHSIPIPDRDRWPRRKWSSVDEAFTYYARPAADSDHLLWAGPTDGRRASLIADGRRHNPGRIAFERHHGRPPQGRLRRTCDEPACIHGAHHTDQLLRQKPPATRPAPTDIEALFNAIFNTEGTP